MRQVDIASGPIRELNCTSHIPDDVHDVEERRARSTCCENRRRNDRLYVPVKHRTTTEKATATSEFFIFVMSLSFYEKCVERVYLLLYITLLITYIAIVTLLLRLLRLLLSIIIIIIIVIIIIIIVAILRYCRHDYYHYHYYHYIIIAD